MARNGYARMSMDRLAAEAGVTKPSVYLRFPGGKAEVATAALAALRERSAGADTGNTRADLVMHLRRLRRGLARPQGMAMLGTVLAEERQTPKLLARFREHVVLPRRRLIRAVLERARERGELRSGVDLDDVVAMLVGSFYASHLARGRIPRGLEERIVDVALDGIRARTSH
jgi:AcrR family transcriptional regulator